MEEPRESTDAEKAARFWRRVFAAALLVGPAGAMLLNKGWPWIVSAGKESVRPGWGFGLGEILIWAGAVAWPLLALGGLWIQRRWGSRTRGVWILAATAVCVLAAEAGLRNRSIQSYFWTAVISRLEAPDWGMKEPAMLHYENLKAAAGEKIPRGVAIFGSSQGAVNFDRDFMARELQRPVIRRALNGMFALEMCAAQPMLAVPRAQTAVFYLSPLDLAANVDVRANWMRSLISPRSWMDLVAVLGPRLAFENRRPLSELAVAAVWRLWAFRDGTRWILFNLAGRTPDPVPRHPTDKTPSPLVKPLDIKQEYVEARFRGYRHVFSRLKGLGFDIVVFQGEVNPVLRRQIADDYWTPMEARMRSFFDSNGVAYVLRDEYRPGLGPDDWADNTHLNGAGRQKLSQAAVGYLQRQVDR